MDFEKDWIANAYEGMSRRQFMAQMSAAGVALAGFAIASKDVAGEIITTPIDGLTVGEGQVASAGFQVPIYQARPAAAGRYPVVIVIPEIWGMHAYIKDVVRRFARRGFLAITFEPYDPHRGGAAYRGARGTAEGGQCRAGRPGRGRSRWLTNFATGDLTALGSTLLGFNPWETFLNQLWGTSSASVLSPGSQSGYYEIDWIESDWTALPGPLRILNNVPLFVSDWGVGINDFIKLIQAWLPWMKWAAGFFNAAGLIVAAIGVSSKISTATNLNIDAIDSMSQNLREAVGKQKVVIQEKRVHIL